MAAKNGNDELETFVERIGRLEGEKKDLSDDIKSVYAEAKEKGYNVKALRQAVKVQQLPPEDRLAVIATLETLDTYLNALGLLADTELGQAALARKQSEFKHIGSIASLPV